MSVRNIKSEKQARRIRKVSGVLADNVGFSFELTLKDVSN